MKHAPALLLAVALSACASGSAGPAGTAAVSTPSADPTTLPTTVPTPTTVVAARTPAPTVAPAAFRIAFDPAEPAIAQPFTIVVTGLRPGEAFDLTISPGRPMSQTADSGGRARIVLADGTREPSCVTARRTDGSSVTAGMGSATACAEATAPLTGPSPKVVGPTQYFSIGVNVPVGTRLTFVGVSGPDGRRIADHFGDFGWERTISERPSSHVHRFSPEYERTGPLPAGNYTWSYEVLGKRYDFVVTLAR